MSDREAAKIQIQDSYCLTQASRRAKEPMNPKALSLNEDLKPSQSSPALPSFATEAVLYRPATDRWRCTEAPSLPDPQKKATSGQQDAEGVGFVFRRLGG